MEDFVITTMISPQTIIKPTAQIKLEDSSMEVDSSRKTSTTDRPLLLTSIQHKPYQGKKHQNIATKKASVMAQKSQLRSPRFVEPDGAQPRGLHPYTPPPILSPMRNGSGLFWQIAKNLGHPSQLTIAEDQEMSVDSPGLRIVDEGAGPSDTNSTDVTATTSTEVVHPARKNGFICSQATFADELEALRKISWASTSSSTRSAEEILRKHSMDPDEYLRKASCISDCYYDLPIDTRPKMSDAVPHINIGREYQARVRKWNDRKIHESELEAIEDRDEMVFSPDVLRDIEKDQSQFILIDFIDFGCITQILKTLCLVEAFELLACSQAIPRPGKNKELALHLLMENKGNIEAAVADLLRSDTLDWEQYQVIYGSSYVDSAAWTPEEVNAFQDAIYKTEKDFHQVAQELPSKTVRECVEFYYTWKKACPDDYRKLRNLRRKRQLLELNLQQMDEGTPAKLAPVDENVSSDAESDTTAPSYCGQDIFEMRGRTGSFLSQTNVAMSPLRDVPSLPSSSSMSQSLLGLRPSPPLKDLSGLQRNYQPSAPRSQPSSGSKKGAQPSADGFFHCRLCDKCFEKVKSLNAHMKSHAMKARAEAEAKAQVDAQLAAQSNALQNGHLNLTGLSSSLQGVTQSLPTVSSHPASGLNFQHGLSHSLLSSQGIGLPHPRAQHPLLSQVHSAIIH
ncbi:Myb-like DNA-binding domain protein [Teladorsagia circumcincta]|uniref:Myb-like DNA-binding domain protein n=1 Tax=Teladorsagia circumcincta TaxID=45464 RepID=A0A2G9V1G3_TELCI|nr:Myb-like DNA-binding domain protein [Teladorsagia circumcincta]